MVAVKAKEAIEGVRQAMDRNLRYHFPEVRGPFVHAPTADEHEVLWHCARTKLPNTALEPDGRNVVLSAAVRASADLDMT
jgi:hypothetical protein